MAFDATDFVNSLSGVPLAIVQSFGRAMTAFYGEERTVHRKVAVAATVVIFLFLGFGVLGLMFAIAPFAAAVLVGLWLIGGIAFFIGYKVTIPHGGMAFKEDFLGTLHKAEHGDVEAMRQIAAIYRRGGDGVPRSPSDSVWWLARAAEAGSVEAAFEVGGYVEGGEGAPRDIKKALEWYKCAEKAGHVMAKNAVIRIEQELDRKSRL